MAARRRLSENRVVLVLSPAIVIVLGVAIMATGACGWVLVPECLAAKKRRGVVRELVVHVVDLLCVGGGEPGWWWWWLVVLGGDGAAQGEVSRGGAWAHSSRAIQKTRRRGGVHVNPGAVV